jgi:hypothetical protein
MKFRKSRDGTGATLSKSLILSGAYSSWGPGKFQAPEPKPLGAEGENALGVFHVEHLTIQARTLFHVEHSFFTTRGSPVAFPASSEH